MFYKKHVLITCAYYYTLLLYIFFYGNVFVHIIFIVKYLSQNVQRFVEIQKIICYLPIDHYKTLLSRTLSSVDSESIIWLSFPI